MTRLGQKRAERQMSFRVHWRMPANVRLSLTEAARVLRVNRATVGRWRIKFEADRRVTSLLPRRRGRLAGACQIDPRVDELIAAQLRIYCLQPERPSIRSLLERVHTSCDELGLPKPSWRAIKLRIQRLDARTKIARREVAAAARAIFTPVVDEYRSAVTGRQAGPPRHMNQDRIAWTLPPNAARTNAPPIAATTSSRPRSSSTRKYFRSVLSEMCSISAITRNGVPFAT